ncbi:hypothetical protein Xmir_03397 [Xenorhabdus miraniensis]|uniref:Uncharacterized protein n=1 Tax=Xenorhabdus miraniensis TaxID=351674 RepID=A0A2D0JKD6_9GAMM|nr:hypothetical protein Xmir_04087 [Xenorhabdus miraniensis]PHM47341.1 hypothetical protein Xmir_03397 [Xenorhabdus miraniensis]
MFQPQYRLPNGTQPGFQFITGSNIVVPVFPDWLWQGVAIHFTVPGQGHGLNAGKAGRQHIFRQAGGEIPNQDIIRQGTLCDQIRGQYFIPVMFMDNHHRLSDLRVGSKGIFDFPQLNAETADFDLKIIAPKVFDIAVRQPATEIPGLVHAGIRIREEGIGQETLFRQFRAVQIATGDTRSTDMNFTHCPHRNKLPVRIKQINPGIANGPANRD